MKSAGLIKKKLIIAKKITTLKDPIQVFFNSEIISSKFDSLYFLESTLKANKYFFQKLFGSFIAVKYPIKYNVYEDISSFKLSQISQFFKKIIIKHHNLFYTLSYNLLGLFFVTNTVRILQFILGFFKIILFFSQCKFFNKLH